MALWTDYVQKESPEDEDTLLVYDSMERDNKQVTLANLHNYEKEKLESTQFALETKEKTLLLAINELKRGSDLTDENVEKMVEGTLIVGEAKKVNGYTVNSDVPENAVFTDTVYDDTKVREDIGQLKEDLTSKADKTDLVKTDRKLDALWKLNQGISYEFQKDNTVAYQKTIPSGVKLASVEKIGGRTIVWNQLADNSRVNEWGETFIENKHYNKIENHMLYFRHKIKVKSVIKEQNINTKKIIVFATTTKNIGNVDIKKDELKTGYENIVSAIEKMPKDITDISVYNCGNDEVGNTAECEVSVIVVDLTQMFGSGNEPSTPEEFEAMFPADHYPYNAGELMSASVNEVIYLDTKNQKTSYQIPQAILNLPGYGWSAGDVRNEVNWENKQYVQRVTKYTFQGSEQIINQQSFNTYRWFSVKLPNSKDLDTKMTGDFVSDGIPSYGGYYVNSGILKNASGAFRKYTYIYFSFPINTNIAEQLNGKTIYYELTEPIVTDISDIIGNTFQEPVEVETGGTLMFGNSNGDNYRIPVPSTEEYLVSLAEVAK